MYSIQWARKIVNTFNTYRARESDTILKVLGKSYCDLEFLCARTQKGWNLFKKLAKFRLLRDVLDNGADLLHFDGWLDWMSEKFWDSWIAWEQKGFDEGEEEHLTSFFRRITISSHSPDSLIRS